MHKYFYYSLFVAFLFATESSIAQKVAFEWIPSTTEAFSEEDIPTYAPGFQAGAPSIAGPADLDNDGKIEVILTDYSGGDSLPFYQIF